jgi:hypothetical protein
MEARCSGRFSTIESVSAIDDMIIGNAVGIVGCYRGRLSS